jgi:hypothetical protein
MIRLVLARPYPPHRRGLPIPKGHEAASDERYVRAARAKNEWIYKRRKRGDAVKDLIEELEEAGWMPQGPQAVYTADLAHKRRIGEVKKARKKAVRKAHVHQEDEPLEAPRPKAPKPAAADDEMVREIAEAIAGILKSYIGDLKEKADKWDAIKGLVRDE